LFVTKIKRRQNFSELCGWRKHLWTFVWTAFPINRIERS